MKKGFTLIELLISITLLSIVLIFMLSLLVKLNSKREDNSDLNLLIDQSLMTKKINSDIFNNSGLKSLTCSDGTHCSFTFNNGVVKNIVISNDKTISYGTTTNNDFAKTLPEEYTYEVISLVKNTYVNGDFVKLTISVLDNPQYNIEVYYYGNYEFAEGDTFYFKYTGNYQTFTVPATGKYKVELWGSQGGSYDTTYVGGRGGYTKGDISLNKNNNLYIYIGGQGSITGSAVNICVNGGYNGGGNGCNSQVGPDRYGGSGGGATDIRLTSGTWDNSDSLKSRIMVAGGGGGAWYNSSIYYYGIGGAAGGLTGNTGVGYNSGTYYYPSGGTQTGAGPTGNYLGGFGYGASQPPYGERPGAGSGYYGGNISLFSGGGGSSFISGYSGCNAIYADGTHSNQPNHYSGYIFTNGTMIAGNASMPNPNGGNEIGHSGHGYAKITIIDIY